MGAGSVFYCIGSFSFGGPSSLSSGWATSPSKVSSSLSLMSSPSPLALGVMGTVVSIWIEEKSTSGNKIVACLRKSLKPSPYWEPSKSKKSWESLYPSTMLALAFSMLSWRVPPLVSGQHSLPLTSRLDGQPS